MRINHPLLIKSLGRVGCGLLWLLFRTIKVQVHTRNVHPYDCQDAEHYLYSVWHDSVLMAAFGGRHRGMIALASRHRDGRIGASLVEGVGIRAVRGSSGPSGQTAVRRIIKLASSHDVVITPDGPRGPRRQMSRGIIYLAAKTGNAIVPVAFRCNRAWELKGSWTSLTIPWPFSQVNLAVGDPVYVPAQTSESELEEYVRGLQDTLEQLQRSLEPASAHPSPAVATTSLVDKAA